MAKPNYSFIASLACGVALLTGCPGDDTTDGGSNDETSTGGEDTMQVTSLPTTMTMTTMGMTVGDDDDDDDTTMGDDDDDDDMDTTVGDDDDDDDDDDMTTTGDTGDTEGTTDTGTTTDDPTTGTTTDDPTGTDTGSMFDCVDQVLGNTVPQTVMGDNTGAGDAFAASCAIMGGNAEEFVYEFTAPMDGIYSIDTLGSDIDTILTVLSDCMGTEIACNDDEPGGTLQSQLSVSLASGESILIAVDGWNETGAFTLNITPPPDLPDNPYGDCTLDPAGACEDGEFCLTGNAADGDGIAVCGFTVCVDNSDCPPAPATGDAVVTCADLGGPICVLDCSMGETCPDTMVCDPDALVCVFEQEIPAAQDGGSCCASDSMMPGCDVQEIQDCVCGSIVNDSFCCTDEWDMQCAGEAQDPCNATCM